jgi:hypothetical protein
MEIKFELDTKKATRAAVAIAARTRSAVSPNTAIPPSLPLPTPLP